MNQAAKLNIVTLMDRKEITALGASLRQIDRNILNAGATNGTTKIWYQGGEPYFDMFVELRCAQIEWFQFTLRGKSLSWKPNSQGWQTGTTNELRTDDIAFYPASKTIENDRQADQDFMELAYSILQTRAGEDVFDRVLALFEETTPIQSNL